MPTPHPGHPAADIDGVATRFIDVDGIAVHVAEVAGTGHTVTSEATPDGTPGAATSNGQTAAPGIATTSANESPRTGVVLLHHFYGNVATWRRVLRRLDAHGIPAIAVDRPGFGWSQRPTPRTARGMDPNPYTRAFAVRAAAAAVQAAGFDRVVVVGSSMGGTLAIELAAAVRTGDIDLVPITHLLLLSPAVTGDVGMPPPLRPLLRAGWMGRLMQPLVRRLSRRMDLDRVAGNWHDQSLADDLDIETYRAPTRLTGWEHGIWEVMTVEAPPRLASAIAALDVASTVVAGRHDRLIRPRWNRRTAAALGAELVEVDTGHTPQEEAPDLVVDLIEARVATAADTATHRHDRARSHEAP